MRLSLLDTETCSAMQRKNRHVFQHILCALSQLFRFRAAPKDRDVPNCRPNWKVKVMNANHVRHMGRFLPSFAAISMSLGLLLAIGCSSKPITSMGPAFVTIYPVTSTTVGTGETLAVVATTGSGGVTWTLSGTGCTGVACGTLSNPTPSHVLYVAPASISGSSLSLTLTATTIGTPSATATVSLTVMPTTITFSPANPPGVAPGTSFTLTATVSYDINNEGVTWALSGASCSGSTCGTIVPTTTSVTYTAPQSNGLEVMLTATSIANPNVSASVALSVPKLSTSFKFTPAALPAAIVGQAYSATIQVSGGSAPYVFEELNLPSWVTASSTSDSVTLSGTPTSAGTVDVQLTAIDSSTPQSLAGVAYYPLTTYASAGVSNSLLTGPYAFFGLGWQDGTSNNTVPTEPRIAYIGSLTADGNGNITGGELDVNNYNGLTSYTSVTGTYNIGSNQLGTVTLLPPSTGAITPITLIVGLNGISSNVATLGSFTEYDDSSGVGAAASASSTGIRMTGSLALQTAASLSTSTSPLSGSYAFGMEGRNPSSAQVSTPACQNTTAKAGTTYYFCGGVSLAGALTMGTGGSILTGEEDINQGEETAGAVTLAGALGNSGNTDASGRLTASITATNTSTTPLNDWPSDFIVYVVNPQTFYVMSSDSYATNTLVAGEGMQQNLTDIATTPFSATMPIILHSNVLSTENFTLTPNGNVRTELQLLKVTPTSATAGSMSGTQFVNGSGSYSTPAPVTIASLTYTVASNGRVSPSSDGEPYLYLVDTSQGFGTNFGPNTTNPESEGVFQFQPQTSTTLNAGTYIMSVPFANSEVAPLETGVVVIPAGGVAATATSVPVTGYVYASYSQTSDDESNSAKSLLFNEPVTGALSNSNGVIPSGDITFSTGIQACASGGGYIISSTSFACISGTTGYAEVYIFQQ